MILCILLVGIVVLLTISLSIIHRLLMQRLKEIQHKYPLAANFRQLPSKLSFLNIGQTIGLLRISNIEWEQEEHNRQKFLSIIKYYPNGWKRVAAKYGSLSVEQTISKEQEIKDEELKFQQEKEQEEHNRQKYLLIKRCYPNGWKRVAAKYGRLSVEQTISKEQEIKDEESKFQEEKEQERNAITNSLNTLHSAIIAGDIEKAKQTIIRIDTAIKNPTIDSDIHNKVTEAKREFEKKYNEGILDDTLGTYYVDYDKPMSFVQDANWCYPVAKFPSKGTYIFPHRRRKIARRGYMEEPFQISIADKLSSCKLHIFGDCALLPYEGCRPYEPDIAIIDKDNPSIRIDIEIDEPYAAITNTPTHYIGCGDDMRDMQLNNLGWIVVRFSEEQICTATQDCIAYIAQLIHCLNPDKTFPNDLLSRKQPRRYKRWTEIEAKVMASEKKRETYLQHEFGTTPTPPVTIAAITQTKKESECAKNIKPLNIQQKGTAEICHSMIDLFVRDKDIQFYPQEHIYLYQGTIEFSPVSKVISYFFNPFDSFYWSKIKADQEQVSQGEKLEEWDKKGAEAREVGTFMHQQIAAYYAKKEYQKNYRFQYTGKYICENKNISLANEYAQFVDFLKQHTFIPCRTEWMIYDENLKIAGTIDMLCHNGMTYDIYDWKRSQKVVDTLGNPIQIAAFGNTGIRGLEDIQDTPYWHYCIQQNLYRYILETKYRLQIGKMYLVVFMDSAPTYFKLEVPNMDGTIKTILENLPLIDIG